MPKSVPNIQFLPPQGLKLAYLISTVGGANPLVATNSPFLTQQIITPLTPGNYTFLAGMSGFDALAGVIPPANIGQFNIRVNGIDYPTHLCPFASVDEHKFMGMAGAASVPLLDAGNILECPNNMAGGTSSDDNWRWIAIPNFHGNNRVIMSNPLAAISDTASFNVGTPGRYLALYFGSGFQTAGGVPALQQQQLVIDGPGGTTINASMAYNRLNDREGFCMLPFILPNLGSGDHGITITQATGSTVTDPWTMVLIWDPLGKAQTFYSGTPPITFAGGWQPVQDLTVPQGFAVFGHLTYFSGSGGVSNTLSLNNSDGSANPSEISNLRAAINPANVHQATEVPFIGAGGTTTTPTTGKRFFFGNGTAQPPSAFPFSVDSADIAGIALLPNVFIS
jgi:hypothetical protein